VPTTFVVKPSSLTGSIDAAAPRKTSTVRNVGRAAQKIIIIPIHWEI